MHAGTNNKSVVEEIPQPLKTLNLSGAWAGEAAQKQKWSPVLCCVRGEVRSAFFRDLTDANRNSDAGKLDCRRQAGVRSFHRARRRASVLSSRGSPLHLLVPCLLDGRLLLPL